MATVVAPLCQLEPASRIARRGEGARRPGPWVGRGGVDATDREPTDQDFAAMAKRAMITRMLHNLLGLSGSDPLAMHRYLNAILAIDPESAQHHWLRAIVRFRLELRGQSEEDVDWLLEKRPVGIDYSRVLDLQRAIEQPH